MVDHTEILFFDLLYQSQHFLVLLVQVENDFFGDLLRAKQEEIRLVGVRAFGPPARALQEVEHQGGQLRTTRVHDACRLDLGQVAHPDAGVGRIIDPDFLFVCFGVRMDLLPGDGNFLILESEHRAQVI